MAINRRMKPWVAGFALVLIVMLASGGCGGQASTYKLSPVSSGDLSKKITAAGKLEGTAPTDVVPPATARLASVAVMEGDQVSVGQILACMDQEQLQESVDQAWANYLTNASIGDITSSFFSGLSALNAGVSQGAAQINGFQTQVDVLALTFFDLAPLLVPLLPPSEQEEAEELLAQAEVNYENSVSGRQPFEPVSADISSGTADEADSARRSNSYRDYQKALAALENAEIRAPASGTVIFVPQGGFLSPDFLPSLAASLEALSGGLGLLGASSGGSAGLMSILSGLQPQSEIKAGITVAANQPVFQIVDLKEMTIRTEVEETDIPLVERDQRVEARLDAVPDQVFKGRVVQVGVKAKAGSAGNTIFEAIIQLNRADSSLRIGYNATVDIVVKDLKDVVYVPITALLKEAGQDFVFVNDHGNATRREVRLGITVDDSAQIQEGLEPGEIIVSEGAAKIKEGQKLK